MSKVSCCCTVPVSDKRVGGAGLVCLELYKIIQGKPIEAYRNTFANLALPLFSMAEPIPPKVPLYFRPSIALGFCTSHDCHAVLSH